MTRTGGTIILTVLLAVSAVGWASDLRQIELPSEDELLEALRLGEITTDQYLRLQDILACCADSLPPHLMDEFADLFYSHFPLDTIGADSAGSHDARPPAKPRAVIEHRYLTRIRPDEPSWYYSTIELWPASRVHVRLKTRRALSGSERFVSRSVESKSIRGLVRRLVVGDFTARFGLGVALGYRGKLLDPDRSLSLESFLVPDQGGYNGALLECAAGSLETAHIISAVRDRSHRMTTVGSLFRLSAKSLAPYATLGVTQLMDRGEGHELTVPVTGLGVRHQYRHGSLELEIATQPGQGSAATSVVIEGRHRQDDAQWRYAGWVYGDGFIDLTSGGQAAHISRRDTLETCHFAYSSRRSGQEGLMVETSADLSSTLGLNHRLLLAQFDRSHRQCEYTGGLQWELSSCLKAAGDYVGKWNTAPEDVGTAATAKHKCRFHLRMRFGEITLRTYIAGHAETEEPGWMSVHADMQIDLSRHGKLWFWSRFDRMHRGRLGYWYGFAQGEQQISRLLSGIIKIVHVYSAASVRQHETTVSFEVTATL